MTISRVQYARGAVSSSTSISCTLGSVPTSGNTLIAVIGNCGNNCTVSSVSQTGVTWAKITSSVSDNTIAEVEIWRGIVGTGASQNVTATVSASDYYHILDICEYSGISSTYDKTSLPNSGHSNTVDSGTTGLTSVADELWVGGLCGTSGSAGLSSITNGFTMLDGALFSSVEVALCEKIVSASGYANVSATTSGSPAWAGCLATFPIAQTSGQWTAGNVSSVTNGLKIENSSLKLDSTYSPTFSGLNVSSVYLNYNSGQGQINLKNGSTDAYITRWRY